MVRADERTEEDKSAVEGVTQSHLESLLETTMPLIVRRSQQYEGPWLDRLFPIHLPDGRMVAVTAFSVLPSNLGILEGGLFPEANAQQRARLRAIAAQRYGGPVVELEPFIEPLPEISSPRHPRERLPWMACMARLSSKPVDPKMVSSELTLLWWQDALNLPLPQEIERVAAGVDWARSSEDVDLP